MRMDSLTSTGSFAHHGGRSEYHSDQSRVAILRCFLFVPTIKGRFPLTQKWLKLDLFRPVGPISYKGETPKMYW